MPASRFLKYTGRNWPNPVCSFYLPVSISQDDPVCCGIFIIFHLIFWTTNICWEHISYMLHYQNIPQHGHVFNFCLSTPRPMSSPDTVSNFSVSHCDHTCSMVGCHNHFSPASPQRDYMSQSTLSHDNLANSCGWRPSSHSSPPSETRHVLGNSLLQNQQY